MLWFAFILVSLNLWNQPSPEHQSIYPVVICFHFSIFEPLETTITNYHNIPGVLWFAFILVSLNHWKQQNISFNTSGTVVICFHFSIFEPLETTKPWRYRARTCCDLLSFNYICCNQVGFIWLSTDWIKLARERAMDKKKPDCSEPPYFSCFQITLYLTCKDNISFWKGHINGCNLTE